MSGNTGINGLVIGTDEAIYHDFESEQITILGNQLCNPYSTSNMAAAGAAISWSGDIVETHKYVRFLPNSPQDLKVLDDADLELFDTPFDYEVVTQGTYYHDPGLTIDDYTWLYTVVPSGFQSSTIIAGTSITYEVIESLHLPGDEDVYDPLVFKAFENCGLESELEVDDESGARVSFIRLRKRDVIGDFYVKNNQTNSDEPLNGVGVVARSWFKIRRGVANSSGHFNIEAKYRTRAWVKMVFENNFFAVRGFSTIGVWRLYKPNSKLVGYFKVKSLDNIQFTVNRHSSNNLSIKTRNWVLATLFTGAMYYKDYMDVALISYGTGQKSIWATGLGTYASAPMLRAMGNPLQANFFAVNFLLRGDLSAAATSAAIGIFGVILGDVIIGYADRVESSVKIHEVLFHELSHVYHYRLVGPCYWTLYINYIIANGAYGDGTAPHADKVAISEAFAYDVESIVGYTKYPAYNFSGYNYHSYSESRQGLSSFPWIPQGLFYDLYDNTPSDFYPSNDLTSLPLNAIYNSIDVNNNWECGIDFSMVEHKLKTAFPGNANNIEYIFDYHGK